MRIHKTLTEAPRTALVSWAMIAPDRRAKYARLAVALLFTLAVPIAAHAATGSNPWETGITNLRDLFTGTIARALSLVAIIIGGLMFAFGEGGSKKMLSGIVFGVGMAVAAANFLDWLFPSTGGN